MSTTTTQKLPISQITANRVSLREVNTKDQKFLELVASIKEKGVINAILVRPYHTNSDGERLERGEWSDDDIVGYEVVDGHHRFIGAQHAGLEEMPVTIRELSDAELLEYQIVGNVQKVETKPVEYSKQILRILEENPLLTRAELSRRLGVSVQFVSDRLKLANINSDIVAAAIDEGNVVLANAYVLAKLPEEEQEQWLGRASTESPETFIPAAQARIKQVNEARRQGRKAADEEFTPTEHLRKVGELKAERAEPEVGASTIHSLGLKTPLAGWQAAMDWVLNMDPDSVAQARAKHEARIEERKRKAAARQIEAEAERAKRAEEQAERSRKQKANLEAMAAGKPLPHPEIQEIIEKEKAERAAKREAKESEANEESESE